MMERDRPGVVDVMVVVLSPVLVPVLTVIFLLGFWAERLWRRLAGQEKG